MVRPYQERDSALIRGWHEQSGFGYPFPDLSDPLLCVLGVAETSGKPVAAGAVRLVGEEYLWLDPQASDAAKALAGMRLQRQIEIDTAALGLDCLSAWLPPQIEERFSGTIRRLGWIKSPWSNYTKFL